MSAVQRTLWGGSAAALAALTAATATGHDLWMLASGLLLTGCLVALAVHEVLTWGIRQLRPPHVEVLAARRAIRQVEDNTARLRETRAEVAMLREAVTGVRRASGMCAPAVDGDTEPILRVVGGKLSG